MDANHDDNSLSADLNVGHNYWTDYIYISNLKKDARQIQNMLLY